MAASPVRCRPWLALKGSRSRGTRAPAFTHASAASCNGRLGKLCKWCWRTRSSTANDVASSVALYLRHALVLFRSTGPQSPLSSDGLHEGASSVGRPVPPPSCQTKCLSVHVSRAALIDIDCSLVSHLGSYALRHVPASPCCVQAPPRGAQNLARCCACSGRRTRSTPSRSPRSNVLS